MAKEIYHALEDPNYQDVYVDVEEMRTRVLYDGTELAYRYVHGGFKAKKVKFSFCFPRRDAYKGRFFQYLSPFPGPDEEMASLNKKGADDIGRAVYLFHKTNRLLLHVLEHRPTFFRRHLFEFSHNTVVFFFRSAGQFQRGSTVCQKTSYFTDESHFLHLPSLS